MDTYVNGGLSLLICNLEFVRKLAANFVLNVSLDFGFIIIELFCLFLCRDLKRLKDCC